MDPDEKDLSSSPATKSTDGGKQLAVDIIENVSHKPCEKSKAQPPSSLNPNFPEVVPTGETDKSCSKPPVESMKVFLRIRPLVVSPHKNKSKSSKPSNDKIAWPKFKAGRGGEKVKLDKKKISCIQVCDCHSVTIFPPSTLHRMKSEVYRGFSQVFSADSSQEEVYAKTVSPIVEDFLGGKSGLLAALGPSGSGKTYTVFGSAREPGLVPCALRHIFHPSVDEPNRSFYLSIFEIYVDNGKMEKLSDLSPDGGDVQLQKAGLKGLKELLITDYKQAEALIARAMLRRTIAMTNSNSQSSRSQCIINIRCTTDNIDGNVETPINDSVLTFVDLAGAEREKKTGNQGDRLLESNFINKTSMVFGLCLKSLLEHQKNPKKTLRKHFQSSLLTRYLRDYLEGKKRMSLILTVRPGEEDYLDTSFLLRQASPYMEIKFLSKDETNQSKRHYETMFNVVSGQSKRMKISCRTDSADKVKISTQASSTREELDEGCAKKVSTKPRKIPVSKVNGEITCKTVYAYSEKERDYKILLGVAKSIWSLLKEHNKKIKVLEKRNLELQKEISDLKSCSCRCQKEAYVEVAPLLANTISETTSLSKELVGHRSAPLDSEGEIDVCKEIEKLEDICKNGCDCPEDQRCAYLECKGNMEMTSKSYSSEPLQLPEDHVSAAFHDEAKQNEIIGEAEDGRPTNIKESEKKAHICKTESEHPRDDSEAKQNEIIGEAEDGRPTNIKESEKKANICKTESEHPRDDSEASYEEIMKSSSDQSSAIASKSCRQSTQKNEKQKKYIHCDRGGNFNSASEPGKILIPNEKSSVKTKPKRRLMPASSVLLRHVNNLDFKDEEGPEGGRRGRSYADDNRSASSSASLLRLLRVDALR